MPHAGARHETISDILKTKIRIEISTRFVQPFAHNAIIFKSLPDELIPPSRTMREGLMAPRESIIPVASFQECIVEGRPMSFKFVEAMIIVRIESPRQPSILTPELIYIRAKVTMYFQSTFKSRCLCLRP